MQPLDILNRVKLHQNGYVAESLAVVDLLLALHSSSFRYDSGKPQWAERDLMFWGIPSATPALALALQSVGFSAGSEHGRFPGLEGSVQEGSVAFGMACGVARLLERMHDRRRVCVFLDDVCLKDGATWEIALEAGHERLDSLVVLLSHAGLAKIEPVAAKWEAFGWKVFSLVDGHNVSEIRDMLARAQLPVRRPKILIAPTRLGKGIPFMEGKEAYRRTFFSEAEMQAARVALTPTAR
jgi:transketolase